MKTKTAPQQATRENRGTVVIVGGKGGLESHYREVVERYGYDLAFYEQRVQRKRSANAQRIAMVIVMVSMISHPLLAHARELASGTSLVYLRTPSVSAVRETLERNAHAGA